MLMLVRTAPTGRAQTFPESASREVALSSSAAASSRLKWAFSCSNSLNRFPWPVRTGRRTLPPTVNRTASDKHALSSLE